MAPEVIQRREERIEIARKTACDAAICAIREEGAAAATMLYNKLKGNANDHQRKN